MYNTIKDCFIIFKNIVKAIFAKYKPEIVQDDPEELDTIKFKEESEEDQIELDGMVFMDKYESKILKDKITNELKDLIEIVNIANVEKVKKVELKGLTTGIETTKSTFDFSKDIPPQESRPKIGKVGKKEVFDDEEEFDYYIDYEEEKGQ